jgi:uncharacterized iron-regulated protein
MAAPTDDPRIHDDYVEVLHGDAGADCSADDARTEGRSGDVILVGVVHDHPASVHRVRSLIGS